MVFGGINEYFIGSFFFVGAGVKVRLKEFLGVWREFGGWESLRNFFMAGGWSAGIVLVYIFKYVSI